MLSIIITQAHFIGFIAGMALVILLMLASAIMDWLSSPDPDDEWLDVIRESRDQKPAPSPPTTDPPPHLGDGD